MILFPPNFYVDLDFHLCYSHELITIGAFYSKILSEEINSSKGQMKPIFHYFLNFFLPLQCEEFDYVIP